MSYAKHTTTPYDIAIIGGGPAGLALAAALRDSGLSLCLIEQQPESVLANPLADGRDIALTHRTIKILEDLKIYPLIPKSEMFPIREAQVVNGTSPYILNFDPDDKTKDALGYLLANKFIRRASYQAVKKQKNLTILTGLSVQGITTDETQASIALSNKRHITASLIVGADGRFSNTRRMMGIPVDMHDFGHTAIVCHVKHKLPHNSIAHECFYYGYTLAVLPLGKNLSSIVITMPTDKANALMQLPPAAFSKRVTELAKNRLGAMTLSGKPHTYPLITVYAQRFVAQRFALLGDSAVGMHPVTAHGYNFSLYGQHTLAEEIINASRLGLDIGGDHVLNRFNRIHRETTRWLYLGTNTLVKLYTDDTKRVRHLRTVGLRLGNLLTPVKHLITKQLTDESYAA